MVVGACKVMVLPPPDDLKSIAPSALLAVPRVSALPPWMVTVPVKLAALLIVWAFIRPDVIVPELILIFPV